MDGSKCTRVNLQKEMEGIQKREKKIGIFKIEFGNHSSLYSMDIDDLCVYVCKGERKHFVNTTHIRTFVAVTNIL